MSLLSLCNPRFSVSDHDTKGDRESNVPIQMNDHNVGGDICLGDTAFSFTALYIIRRFLVT